MPSADSIPKNPKVVLATAPGGAAYWGELRSTALTAGLDDVGVAPAVVLERALDRIRDRIGRGLDNGMKFTFLRPERSTNVPALVDAARSVIVGVRSYQLGEPPTQSGEPAVVGPRARVARYAWVDHYGDLKSSLSAVAGRLRRDGHRAVVFADDNSIVDREVAWLAGLGWYGKNANILLPGRGSFFVIGCVVTTAELPTAEPLGDGCGTCNRCTPACPTGAIVEPGVIDANRCLSWLLQKPGVFPREYRVALGDRIYGCDDCQTCCPVTVRGAAPAQVAVGHHSVIASFDAVAMLEMDDDELDRVTDRWYVHGRDMTWVRRNLLIVLGNRGHPDHARTAEIIAGYARHSSSILRAHAVWAAARLGLTWVIEDVRAGSGAQVSTATVAPSVMEHPDADWSDAVAAELADLPALRDDL